MVAFLFGPAYAGLKESASSQHILFSAYCGLLVATCYHVSRCSSDPSTLWSWVVQLATHKDIVETKDETKPDKVQTEEEEEDDSLPRRMRETVVARLRSDAIVCLLVAILVFGVHCSTVFTSRQLQPHLRASPLDDSVRPRPPPPLLCTAIAETTTLVVLLQAADALS